MQNFCQLTVLWVAISAQAFRCSIFSIRKNVRGQWDQQLTSTTKQSRLLNISSIKILIVWSFNTKDAFFEKRLLTRLMRVSYCRAEPEEAVTTPDLRKMPCSSSSFLTLRTWESSVCRSRSWRYFSFEPQINSNSFLTCLLTNGVCWIIKYWEKRKKKQEFVSFQCFNRKTKQFTRCTSYFR